MSEKKKVLMERVSKFEEGVTILHPLIAGALVTGTTIVAVNTASPPIKRFASFVVNGVTGLFRGGNATEEAAALGAGGLINLVKAVIK